MVNPPLRIGSLMLGLLLVSCSVADVDLTGKDCPCPGDWFCTDGVCAPLPPECGQSGRYGLSRFDAAWSAENTLHFSWEVPETTDRGTLDEFVLVVGTDEAEVEACACALAAGARDCGESTARVIRRDENPELGHDTRSNRTNFRDPVRESSVAGLSPDTVYAAQLLAVDTAGGVFRTPSLFHRTTRPTAFAIPFFEGTSAADAYSFPSCASETEAGYRYTVECSPPEGMRESCDAGPPCNEDSWVCDDDPERPRQPSCWSSFAWKYERDAPVSPVTPGGFGDAYLEVRATHSEPSNYGDLYLRGTNAEGEQAWYGLRGPFALRGGDAHRYQVALGALTTEEGVPLTSEHFEGLRIDEVRIGGLFTDKSSVTVQAIAVRY